MRRFGGVGREQAGATAVESEGDRAWRPALSRQRQAVRLATETAAGQTASPERPHPAFWLLVVLAAAGCIATLDIILVLPPEAEQDQLAFLIASGSAVWGLVGLAVFATRRSAPARQGGLIAYDAIRQGLLIAGCLELNLATRMLDLWSPLVGGLLVAVFALFEVVTLGRRPG